MTAQPKMERQHPLKRLHLALRELNESLEYTDGLNDWWREFHGEVAYKTKITGEVLAGLGKSNV